MTTTPATSARLPQLRGRHMVTDGGMETDLIFHYGIDLRCFAAFPLVDSSAGRSILASYYNGYAEIARKAGAGLLLESVTWRANPDWGERLGYSAAELARLNQLAISTLAGLRQEFSATISDVVISGMIGPRGDGYQPGELLDPGAAAEYHAPQVRALAEAGADLISAYTLTDIGEATGIVRAARDAGVPVAISFTVETNGKLPGGQALGEAISAVDAAAPPDYFLVNCAHPRHVAPALAEPGPWRERIVGVRYNASTRSHAELDAATELDEGDIGELAEAHRRLAPALPALTILGGCCGTDARHVAALWDQG
ncbi:MAG TPA: homocysteine S-methyltransferase family protein [Streptosporangiaceae bacterium]|nr:homocysteine S-methyltransferase family protein [Streptosporangiaceae bacterium]